MVTVIDIDASVFDKIYDRSAVLDSDRRISVFDLGWQKARMAKIYDLFPEELQGKAKAHGIGYNVSGLNTGNDICMDKSLSPVDYLMTLLHEYGHFFSGEQTGAQNFAVRASSALQKRMEADGLKEINIAGRVYTAKDLGSVKERAAEVEKNFIDKTFGRYSLN